MASPRDITLLLGEWNRGNLTARDRLLALVYAELLQHFFVDIAAVRGAVGLQLSLIGAAEVGAGDFAPIDARHRIAGSGVGSPATVN